MLPMWLKMWRRAAAARRAAIAAAGVRRRGNSQREAVRIREEDGGREDGEKKWDSRGLRGKRARSLFFRAPRAGTVTRADVASLPSWRIPGE